MLVQTAGEEWREDMTLKVLSTGSQGNCYLLQSGEETLILDCGIPIKDIKIGLNFDISKVVGVLCSHVHKDHSLSVADFEKMGIPVFKPYEDLDNILADENFQLAQKYGDFRIVAFQLPHNGTRNCGFVITVQGQKILYLTDFEYCRYNFRTLKINHILCECNYMQELVDQNLPQYEHKIKGHCSLKTCVDFIKANATDALQTVLLLHMGAETLDCDVAVAEVKKVVGNGVYVDYARKGLCVELKDNRCPF